MKRIIISLLMTTFLLNSIQVNADNVKYNCNITEITDFSEDNWILKFKQANDSNLQTREIYINPLSKDFSWYKEMMKNKNIASLEFADTNKQYLVWNWKKYETYDYVWWEDFWIYLFFSNDKSSVSYIAWNTSTKEIFVIRDWVKQQSYLSISRILNYSPNSNTLVYDAINKDHKKVININWDEILDYQFDNYPNLYYSKDWKYLYAIWDISEKNNLITCELNNSNTQKQVYELNIKEKTAINLLWKKLNKYSESKKTEYKKVLNSYLNQFEIWSRKYQIIQELIKIIK